MEIIEPCFLCGIETDGLGLCPICDNSEPEETDNEAEQI